MSINKYIYATAALSLMTLASYAQSTTQTFAPVGSADVNVYFATNDEGENHPIMWGLDTAWASEENIRRGVRYMGADIIDVARVSFQPIDFLTTPTLTDRLETKLVERLRLISLIKGVGGVQIVLNNDTPDGEYNDSLATPATDEAACEAYCNVIYATALSCQDKGWEVITASPLNEPDYPYNMQGSKDDFLAIAKKLKTYPQFCDGTIRISGGNTLNCDSASLWYNYLYGFIDEGNTHQLAGVFDNYASFFTEVRKDGKYATADELHNIMEAMVGEEYGMQTGIWWGTAELARGEFCKATRGKRLAYAENRDAWTCAGVYRNPENKIQGFVGTSERQALACTYRFVSLDRDVYFNGYGPMREFYTETPGGSTYQDKQTNAECVIDITWGEDVRPVVDGNYKIMNKLTCMPMGIGNIADYAVPTQYGEDESVYLTWAVNPVDEGCGGDYSYFTVNLAENTDMKLDVCNWTLEKNGTIILYNGGLGNNEMWWLKYAGDGYFRIFSRHSALCLALSEDSSTSGVAIVQKEEADDDSQLWRFIPADATCEQDAPLAPTGLSVKAQSSSIKLTWTPSLSSDAASYVVVRAGEDGEYNTIGRDITTTTFIDNTAWLGTNYTYKVKTVDYSGNSSEYTESASAKLSTDQELLGQWLFDESFEDATGNGNDAQSTAATGKYTTGQNDAKALNLITTPLVQLPYMVGNHDETTISGWFLLRVATGTQSIFSFERSDEAYLWLYIESDGTMYLELRNGDSHAQIQSSEVLPTKEWAHVAVTVSESDAAIYLNGAKVAEGMVSSDLALSAIAPVSCNVGSSIAFSASSFHGYLQDLRIYGYAVDEETIPGTMDLVASVTSVDMDDANGTVEYFNLQGMRILNPSTGNIYIRRTTLPNGKTVNAKCKM